MRAISSLVVAPVAAASVAALWRGTMARPKSRVSNVRLTGPLAPFADVYTAKLREQAHTPLTIVDQLRQVARLSCWLEGSGLTAAELTGERVDEFLAFQRAGGRDRGSWSRLGLVYLLDVFGRAGDAAAEAPARAGTPTEMVLASFERYLLSERCLSAGTVRGYVRAAVPEPGRLTGMHSPTASAPRMHRPERRRGEGDEHPWMRRDRLG
jgi:hypothetical protein